MVGRLLHVFLVTFMLFLGNLKATVFTNWQNIACFVPIKDLYCQQSLNLMQFCVLENIARLKLAIMAGGITQRTIQ